MITELSKILPSFLGEECHVRCFAHTVNLAAKGVLRPFEPKKRKDNDEEIFTNGDLEELQEELQAEFRDLEENGAQETDDDDGFVDVLNEMTALERDEWEAGIVPLRMALKKVSRSTIGHKTNRYITILGNFSWLGTNRELFPLIVIISSIGFLIGLLDWFTNGSAPI